MHLEVLTHEGKKLLPYLSFKNYILGGGTAIALQIGHRISVDFDFFSPEKIPRTFLSTLKQKFPKDFEINPVINNSDELTILIEGVKITFLYYPFAVIEPISQDQGLQIFSLQELAATKAYTLGRREELKDYIDLYFLLKEKYCDLKQIIDLAQKKFVNDFNDRLFLEQLIDLDSIPETKITLLRESNLSEELMREFFKSELENLKI